MLINQAKDLIIITCQKAISDADITQALRRLTHCLVDCDCEDDFDFLKRQRDKLYQKAKIDPEGRLPVFMLLCGSMTLILAPFIRFAANIKLCPSLIKPIIDALVLDFGPYEPAPHYEHDDPLMMKKSCSYECPHPLSVDGVLTIIMLLALLATWPVYRVGNHFSLFQRPDLPWRLIDEFANFDWLSREKQIQLGDRRDTLSIDR